MGLVFKNFIIPESPTGLSYAGGTPLHIQGVHMNSACPRARPATFKETLKEVEAVQITPYIVRESRDT